MAARIQVLWALVIALGAVSLGLIFGLIHITGTVPWWTVMLACIAGFVWVAAA